MQDMYAMERPCFSLGAGPNVLYLFLPLKLKYTLHLLQLVMEFSYGSLWHFCTGRCVVLHHLMDSAAARGILARQGVGRIRHLSRRIFLLQQLVKSKGEVVPTTNDEPELFHIVSGVSGSNNITGLGTKRLGKTRLCELINFCNLGYVVGDTFTPFSEHVFERKQVVALLKSLEKKSGVVASIIADASLIQSALGQRAMDDSCTTDNLIQESSDEWSISWWTMFVVAFTLLVGAGGYAFYRWHNRAPPEADDDAGEEEDPATKWCRYQSLKRFGT